jgi:hypothetical protein
MVNALKQKMKMFGPKENPQVRNLSWTFALLQEAWAFF